MGFFSDLFGLNTYPLYPSIPQIATVMTDQNINDIYAGQIKPIPVKKIVLKYGEQCLFCDYAVLITEKLQVVGRQGNGGSFSFRIMKGMYYHTGNRGNTVIREKIPEYFPGKLYITNKRIVFSADSNAFQYPIYELISFRTEEGCLVLQFSRKSVRIYLPIAECAEKVIEYIV